MSLKTKLTSLITTFVLLCSLLTVGVFAVKNTTFNVGGDIVFNVQGIEADIELTTNGVQNAEFNNDEEIGKDVLKKIEIRNNTSADSIASQFATWSNLDMTFANGATTATIEFKITNMASEEDNYIDLSAIATATTKNNARISVANNAGGITALLKSGENATFTITFSVKDDGYSASLEGFSVNFDMQKKVLADFPVLSADMTYQTLKFRTISGQSGLSVEDIGAGNWNYQSTGVLVIPAYVNNGGTIYSITKIADNAFGNINQVNSCYELLGVVIPDTITIIGEAAFQDCSSLKDINIPDSVISIGDSAFDAVKIGNLVLGKNVQEIGNFVFSYSSLECITIPVSVTKIGGDCFYEISSLEINYEGTEEQWNQILISNIDQEDVLLAWEKYTINFNYVGE